MFHLILILLGLIDPSAGRLVIDLDHDDFAIRESAGRKLAALDSKAAWALRREAAAPRSAESGRRCRELLDSLERARAKRIIDRVDACYRPDDWPEIDSLWLIVSSPYSHYYDARGEINPAHKLLHDWLTHYIDVAQLQIGPGPDGGWQDSTRDPRRFPSWRVACRLWVIDMAGLGVPPEAFRTLFLEMHRRDDAAGYGIKGPGQP